jgi:hypothetical protein
MRLSAASGQGEPSEADPLERIGRAHHFQRGPRQVRGRSFYLDDQRHSAVPGEHLAQRRDADALSSKRMSRVGPEVEGRIHAGQLRRGPGADSAARVSRAIEPLVVVDDRAAVP